MSDELPAWAEDSLREARRRMEAGCPVSRKRWLWPFWPGSYVSGCSEPEFGITTSPKETTRRRMAAASMTSAACGIAKSR